MSHQWVKFERTAYQYLILMASFPILNIQPRKLRKSIQNLLLVHRVEETKTLQNIDYIWRINGNLLVKYISLQFGLAICQTEEGFVHALSRIQLSNG